MQPSILDYTSELLRRHGRRLVVVAVVALVPALAVTALIDVLGAADGAIVNGELVRDGGPEPATTLRMSASIGGASLDLALPLLLALGWLAALAVGTRILVGDSPRKAVRRAAARAIGCLLLAALLGGLLVLAIIAAVQVSAFLEGAVLVGLAVMVACVYGLARLALALPALLIEESNASTALRRTAVITQGRTFVNGTALIVCAALIPAAALALAESLGRGLSGGGSLVMVGVATVVHHAVLIAAVPVQTALLVGAYLVATGAERPAEPPTVEAALLPDPPEPVRPFTSTPRWLRIATLAVLAVLPAALTSSLVAANPRELPVLSLANPADGFRDDLLAIRPLDDGGVAAIGSIQVAVCRDVHCSESYLGGLPCEDGGEPQAVAPRTRMCSSEGPIQAGDITGDGTLLMISRASPGNNARLVWCRVVPNSPDSRCVWGGATTLRTQPEPWENWSMSIVATPSGGFAAAMLGPGLDEHHGVVLLLTCERIDCPQPTVRPVLEIALPEGTWGAGTVDVAVDRVTGALALGYLDPTTSALWLGGCAADCPDGIAFSQVTGSPGPLTEAFPFLEVVTTRAGPAAVVGTGWGDYVEAVACDDPACLSMNYVGLGSWESAWPAVDGDGDLYLVASTGDGNAVAIDVARERLTDLMTGGEVIGATFGSAGQLHAVVRERETTTLITLAL